MRAGAEDDDGCAVELGCPLQGEVVAISPVRAEREDLIAGDVQAAAAAAALVVVALVLRRAALLSARSRASARSFAVTSRVRPSSVSVAFRISSDQRPRSTETIFSDLTVLFGFHSAVMREVVERARACQDPSSGYEAMRRDIPSTRARASGEEEVEDGKAGGRLRGRLAGEPRQAGDGEDPEGSQGGGRFPEQGAQADHRISKLPAAPVLVKTDRRKIGGHDTRSPIKNMVNGYHVPQFLLGPFPLFAFGVDPQGNQTDQVNTKVPVCKKEDAVIWAVWGTSPPPLLFPVSGIPAVSRSRTTSPGRGRLSIISRTSIRTGLWFFSCQSSTLHTIYCGFHAKSSPRGRGPVAGGIILSDRNRPDPRALPGGRAPASPVSEKIGGHDTRSPYF